MSGTTVLVIEDNESVAQGLRGALESSGYQVITCDTGEHAIRQFQQSSQTIGLVITDTSLGDRMNGLDVIAGIRALRPEQPILRISAVPETESEIDHGGVPYLLKPFTQTMLLDRVAETLDHST